MKPSNWNDVLALVLIVLIFAILIGLVITQADLRTEILAMLGPILTLIIQYYFRKSPPAK